MSELNSRTGVSLRAVLTGVFFVLAISLISPWAILMVQGSQLTSNAIPIIAVALLFIVTVVAMPLLRSLGKTFAFNREELITIYDDDAGRLCRSYHGLYWLFPVGHNGRHVLRYA